MTITGNAIEADPTVDVRRDSASGDRAVRGPYGVDGAELTGGSGRGRCQLDGVAGPSRPLGKWCRRADARHHSYARRPA